ncbi:MAG: DUF2490 domain-containing protein [Balneolaceae bacterium]
MIKKWYPFAILLILPSLALAQSNTDFIWRPIVGYSWSGTDKLNYSIKLEMFNSVEDFDNRSAIQYIEPQFSASYSISPNIKLGGGFYSRWVDPLEPGYAYEQRLLQQISVNSFIGNYRFTHRARLEQRFRNTNYLNRFRYLISHRLPLHGKTIDPGENFLVFSNDAMLSFNRTIFSGENRAEIGIGWLFQNQQQFELTLGYRTKNIFTDSDIGHVFLLTTSFQVKN